MNSTFLSSKFIQEEISIGNFPINQSGMEDSNTTLYNNVTLISTLNSSFFQSQIVFSISEKSVVGSMCVLILLLGFGLNLLTIFIVKQGKNIGKEVKIQLINLAIADIAMAILDPTWAAIILLEISFPDSPILCKITTVAKAAANYTSLLCNVAISLERFVIIYFPFKASQYRKRHKLLVIAAVWIVGALHGIGGLMLADVIQIENRVYCTDLYFPYSLSLVLEVLKYATPAFVIVSAYTLVFIKLCFQKSNGIKRNSSHQRKKNLDKVIVTFVTFELIYLIFTRKYTFIRKIVVSLCIYKM